VRKWGRRSADAAAAGAGSVVVAVGGAGAWSAAGGAAALTVEECHTESLQARPDPKPFPEHAVIDFTSVDEKHWRAKSKKLQAKAKARGWMYSA